MRLQIPVRATEAWCSSRLEKVFVLWRKAPQVRPKATPRTKCGFESWAQGWGIIPAESSGSGVGRLEAPPLHPGHPGPLISEP